MKAYVKDKNILISNNIKQALSIKDRVIGLMFKKSLNFNEGLLLSPCNSIHTCFMRFPIDVVFIDKNNKVLNIIHSMRPWKFSLIYFKSKKVLELNGNTLPLEVRVGDTLEFTNV